MLSVVIWCHFTFTLKVRNKELSDSESFSCHFDFLKKVILRVKYFFVMHLQFMLYNVIASASFILVR